MSDLSNVTPRYLGSEQKGRVSLLKLTFSSRLAFLFVEVEDCRHCFCNAKLQLSGLGVFTYSRQDFAEHSFQELGGGLETLPIIEPIISAQAGLDILLSLLMTGCVGEWILLGGPVCIAEVDVVGLLHVFDTRRSKPEPD